MDRAQMLQDLTDSLDGAATEVQLQGLEDALRADDSYRRLAADYYVQDSLLEELMEPPPSRISAGQIRARAEKPRPSLNGEADRRERRVRPDEAHAAPRPGKHRHRNGRAASSAGRSAGSFPWMAWAALVALAAGLGVWAFHGSAQPPAQVVQAEPAPKPEPAVVPKKEEPAAKSEDPIVSVAGGIYKREGNTLSTDHRSTIDVKLSDGSSVALHPRTSVAFGKPGAEVRQDLELKEGRLVVTAAKDKRVFKVRVGEKSSVTVVGTRFVVHMPEHRAMGADAGVVALVGVEEGAVRLKNERGELALEAGPQAVLSDAFAPVKISRDEEYHGFEGKVQGQILFKGDARLLLRIAEAQAGGENKFRDPQLLKDKLVWLYLPEERMEEGRERVLHYFKEVKVMSNVRLSCRFGKGHLVLAPPAH